MTILKQIKVVKTRGIDNLDISDLTLFDIVRTAQNIFRKDNEQDFIFFNRLSDSLFKVEDGNGYIFMQVAIKIPEGIDVLYSKMDDYGDYYVQTILLPEEY